MKIKMEIINIGGIWNAIINNSIPQRYSDLSDKEKVIFTLLLKYKKTY
jgi:hypothetical protein